MGPEAGSFPDVSEPRFHFVCAASALVGVPAKWVTEMLGEGEIAVLADEGDFDAVNEVAHTLGLISVPLIRREETMERQRERAMAYADRLPLASVAEDLGETVTAWARGRGPMTANRYTLVWVGPCGSNHGRHRCPQARELV